MQGKGKILLDVSETSSRINIRHSCGSIELKMEKDLFLALNAFAEEISIDLRCTRQIFLEHLTTSLRDR